MFATLLAVPLAISLFNPFPSLKPFPFPGASHTPVPTQTPGPTTTPSQNPTPTPSVTTAIEIDDIDPSSANFMQEFTLTGSNFGASAGSVSFRYYNQSFSSGDAPIVSWSNNEIKAKVPAVKKGSYRIQVIRSDGKKTNEIKFTVKNGQPIIDATSIKGVNGKYELTFDGSEFGIKRGEINIYEGSSIVAKGIIKSWSSSRVRFELPTLSHKEYGFQIQAADGRQSSLKYFTVGN